jgi:membrane fusion protein (multidrug efflux system)
VAVQPAEPSDIPIYIQVSGRLQSVNRMDLYAEVSGVLKNSNFRSGQSFGAGQPIATIDDSEYRAQLIAARSTFMGLISQSLADLTLDYPEDANEWKLFLQSINPKEKLPELPRVENQQLKTVSERKKHTQQLLHD